MKVSTGDRIKHIPASDLSAGSVVGLSTMIGIATEDIKAGQNGTLLIEAIAQLPRVSVVLGGISVGRILYWDDAAQDTLVTGGGLRIRCGKCVEFSAQVASSVRVKLIP